MSKNFLVMFTYQNLFVGLFSRCTPSSPKYRNEKDSSFQGKLAIVHGVLWSLCLLTFVWYASE